MNRRVFLSTVTGGLLAAPLVTYAQQPDRAWRLGLLLPYIQNDPQTHARVNAFTTALQERGWTDGRNVRFEFRYTDGHPERLPALAADLAQRHVDVILTAGTESTDAARKATKTIPIVMAAVGDPIAAGFIASLARPGGNVTGAQPSRDRVNRQATATTEGCPPCAHAIDGFLERRQCQCHPEAEADTGSRPALQSATPHVRAAHPRRS